ncbi:unnamed protein product [Pleuronectes platessa]|uniref:Uncharacterized protein n=1 Tax=Pleuronectes platessa TaxID=8262 RepID=A0A9N7VEK6_PLEPL|nr:unnamed protein product [Pleuronectes platessa]
MRRRTFQFRRLCTSRSSNAVRRQLPFKQTNNMDNSDEPEDLLDGKIVFQKNKDRTFSKTKGKPPVVKTKMQHLAHPSPFPTGSQFLQQKFDKASYDLHKQKVKSAEKTINTTPPKTYSHLDLKLKKQKLEEKRTLRIQQENTMLMERISHIMRTTGGVDNRNHYDTKSLGKEKRQLESLRITEENQMILFRLSQCRPHYNVMSWHDDWLKTLKLMDSIAHYPRGRAKLQKVIEYNPYI